MQKAKALLSDPLFVEAFDTVEKAIHDKWAATPLRDKEGAHELKLMLKLLKDVRRNVEKVASEGKSELHRSKDRVILGDIWQRMKKA